MLSSSSALSSSCPSSAAAGAARAGRGAARGGSALRRPEPEAAAAAARPARAVLRRLPAGGGRGERGRRAAALLRGPAALPPQVPGLRHQGAGRGVLALPGSHAAGRRHALLPEPRDAVEHAKVPGHGHALLPRPHQLRPVVPGGQDVARGGRRGRGRGRAAPLSAGLRRHAVQTLRRGGEQGTEAATDAGDGLWLPAQRLLAGLARLELAQRPPDGLVARVVEQGEADESYGHFGVLWWLACELGETAYSFSDFAVGTVGWELLSAGRRNDGVLCGDALQHYPVQMNPAKGPGEDVEPLYMNSDNILEWGQGSRRLYRTAARPAELYPGSFTERKLLQTCPFDVTTMELAPLEAMLLTQRKEFYDVVAGWIGEYPGTCAALISAVAPSIFFMIASCSSSVDSAYPGISKKQELVNLYCSSLVGAGGTLQKKIRLPCWLESCVQKPHGRHVRTLKTVPYSSRVDSLAAGSNGAIDVADSSATRKIRHVLDEPIGAGRVRGYSRISGNGGGAVERE
ncbi:hypothetical protein ON010_g1885 [Phytophthora cinnamomi]|nr:hypothetical protein ON010_g1885 [Phytophthora cinnamomi]